VNGEITSEDTAAGHSPTARDIAIVLHRQKNIIAISFAIVLVAVVSYSVFFPSYRAEMKLLVRKGRVDPPVAPQPTALEYSRYDVTEEEINSEAQLLQDWDVLRPVVVKTGLSRDDAWWHRRGDDEARVARAVRRLAQRLEVVPVRKTRLITVAYNANTPDAAAQVLRELSATYLQKHLAAHRPPRESAFFERQTDGYRRALNDAEGRLLGSIHDDAIISPDLQRDLQLQKLNEADASYQQLSVQSSETEERIRALRAQLDGLPDRRTTEVRTADNPELLQQLKSTLLNLELKKTELLTKYEPGYRLVQEVEQQIRDTRTSIAAESLAPIRQETTNNEPRYDWATSELEKAEVDARALRARRDAAAALVNAYRREAQKLGESAIRHQELVRTAKVAEENYLLFLRKREEARMGDALDEQGILNVAVIQEPVAPALPKWSLTAITCFGFLLASILSTVAGFTLDYLHPGYRTPEELTRSLGVPTLASLPREAA
jgi:uncharacterized protein involved in exopolysaccharide biosynthesis